MHALCDSINLSLAWLVTPFFSFPHIQSHTKMDYFKKPSYILKKLNLFTEKDTCLVYTHSVILVIQAI